MNDLIKLTDYKIISKIEKETNGELLLIRKAQSQELFLARIFQRSKIHQKNVNEEMERLFHLDYHCILRTIGYSPVDFNNKQNIVVITEYLSDFTLQKLLDDQRRGLAPKEWDDSKKLIVLYGIAYGMSCLHSKKLTHRDLKPKNIYLDKYFYPKIYYLAETNLDVRPPTSIYTSPELLQFNKYNKQKNDVYAFAIIAYQIITGCEPFPGMSLDEVIKFTAEGNRPSFPDSGIDPIYKDLIEKCWSPYPSIRLYFDQIVNTFKVDYDFPNHIDGFQEFLDYIDFVENDKMLEYEPISIALNQEPNFENDQEMQQSDIDDTKEEEEEDNERVKIVEVEKPEKIIETEENEQEILNDNENDNDIKPTKNNDDIEKSEPAEKNKPDKKQKSKKKKVNQGLKDDDKEVPESNMKKKKIKLLPDDEDDQNATEQIQKKKNKKTQSEEENNQDVTEPKKTKKKKGKNQPTKSETNDEQNDQNEDINIGICPKSIYDSLSSQSKSLIRKATTDQIAQYNVAMNFIDGIGKYPKNPKIGVSYLLLSIENGNENAVIYYNDKFISRRKYINEANEFVKKHLNDQNPTIDLFNGMLCMKSNDYAKAIKLFRKSASNWNSKAASQLGAIYRDGLGVNKNSKLSTDYFLLAKKIKNENTNKTKPCKLPSIVDESDLVKKPTDKNESPKVLYEKGMKYKETELSNSIYFFTLAADKDHLKSMKELIDIYLNKSDEPNYKKALKYLNMAADKGDVDSMRQIAEIYQEGKGVQQNLPEAAKFYKLAAKNGDAESMYKYGLMLEKPQGIEQNLEKAFHYFKLSAKKENRRAMYHCAKMLMNGIGTPVDMEKAISYLQDAADHGNTKAQRELEGMKHIKIKIDADNGDVESMFSYGMMLLEGKEVSKNEKQAIKYLKKAAENGHKKAPKVLKKAEERLLIKSNNPKSMFIYGKELENTRKNQDEAKIWYKKAADLNYIPGMVNYARLIDYTLKEYRKLVHLHKKTNITKDEYQKLEIEAAKYYKMAADKGDKIALNYYGLYLEHGNGMKVNLKKAAECYRTAANKGNLDSMSNYARCLEHGIGVAKNEKEALKWYKKAKESGSKRAIGEYNYLKRKLDNAADDIENEEEEEERNIIDETDDDDDNEDDDIFDDDKIDDDDDDDDIFGDDDDDDDNDFDENDEEDGED